MSRRSLNAEDRAELDRLTKRNGAIADRDVLEAARPNESILHRHFPWDDHEAAEMARLGIAHEIVVAYKITIEVRGKKLMVRKYWSPPSGRQHRPGVSYSIDRVMTDKEMRAEMIAEITAELDAIRERHHTITELSKVWGAIKDARKAHG